MIPKILHYCFGLSADYGGIPWGLSHYVCMRSAVERIKPTQVFFYCEYEPMGPWWRLSQGLVTVVRIKAPREIFGNPVHHPAHRADVVRLQKLLETGGIYLDADVFVHRDFDDLLDHSVVLAKEGDNNREIGLCNAVILSEPNAPFLRKWYSAYKTFRSGGHDSFWNEHSVQLPARLAKDFPDEVTVLPKTAFFWPFWNDTGLEALFVSSDPILPADRYANHLWESKAWERYLLDLTPGRVRSVNSNFNFWARPMVSTLPDNFGKLGITARLIRGIKSIIKYAMPKVRNRIRRINRTIIEIVSSTLGR